MTADPKPGATKAIEERMREKSTLQAYGRAVQIEDAIAIAEEAVAAERERRAEVDSLNGEEYDRLVRERNELRAGIIVAANAHARGDADAVSEALTRDGAPERAREWQRELEARAERAEAALAEVLARLPKPRAIDRSTKLGAAILDAFLPPKSKKMAMSELNRAYEEVIDAIEKAERERDEARADLAKANEEIEDWRDGMYRAEGGG